MEWIHEGAEEFSVMVADNRKSRSSSRRLRSSRGLLGLFYYLFSKASISPMFTFLWCKGGKFQH